MAYLSTITLNVELTTGGRDEKSSSQYEAQQRWYSLVDIVPPNEKVVDNVQGTVYKTEISFWEPDAAQRPFPESLAFVTGQFFFVTSEVEQTLIIRANPLRTLPHSNDSSANIPEWFAPVVNIVGHAGPLTQRHDSGMRSFDVRCTSYNPEAAGKYKSCEFMTRCFFDTGRRWESYEPPRAGTLVHIIGQLVGRYKMGGNEEPAVLITDYKILVSSGKASTAASGDGASTDTITPKKRKYGPKSTGVTMSPVTPETRGKRISQERLLSSPNSRVRHHPVAVFSGDDEDAAMTDEDDLFDSGVAGSSTVSGGAERDDTAHSKDMEGRHNDEAETTRQQRPKRAKRIK
ncbi:hypothetical protein V502_01867 [Pseudogymnoascus sp. VKM F-4520 (FW-2644)]|nr:hypothetical protein V502_01867 [Pseudogymnoascus sp. VKM F-4520 (FW-2644)]